MKRILTWYVDNPLGGDDNQGPVYYADHDYAPDACRLYARIAPAAGDLTVDIRADGVSLFTANYAALNKGANLEEHAEDYDGEPMISEGAVVSFHVINGAGAKGITCSLEMDSLADEDDPSE